MEKISFSGDKMIIHQIGRKDDTNWRKKSRSKALLHKKENKEFPLQ